MSTSKKILLIFFLAVITANLPFFDFFFLENYTYSNFDGSFQYSEEGSFNRSFASCQFNYGVFLCRHPEKDQEDNRLYRTFTIKPWRFWEWRQFIFHSERFSLPYREPPLH